MRTSLVTIQESKSQVIAPSDESGCAKGSIWTHQQPKRVRLYTCPWRSPQPIWDKCASSFFSLHSLVRGTFFFSAGLIIPFTAIFSLWDWTVASSPHFYQCTLIEFMEQSQEFHLLTSETGFMSRKRGSSQSLSYSSNRNPPSSGRITLPVAFNRSPIKLFSHILMNGSESQ